MFYYNQYAHTHFLREELTSMIPSDSFGAAMRRSIGDELHYRLVDWPDADEVGFSSLFPVESLYLWVCEKGGLDPAWLASDDGTYRDQNGAIVSQSFDAASFAVEQLVSYGLWLINENLPCMGDVPPHTDEGGNGFNEFGQARESVIEHQSSCLLFAYQALTYARKLVDKVPLSKEEKQKVSAFDFSSLGRKGALKRHAAMAALRSWAIEKYQAGEWQSANQAAHSLKESVIRYGRTINAHLTEENAQRTIADWFRKSA